MNLHEYQSKALMRQYALPVLDGRLCYTPKEAQAAADVIGGELWVVKAQVHAGGRGKAGGVKLARSPEEVRRCAEEILGMRLVTPQTGKKGKLVSKVYVEGGCDIAKEFYLSFLVDRACCCISMIISPEGGMEIEEVADKSPDKILTLRIDPKIGLHPFHCMRAGFFLNLNLDQVRKLQKVLQGCFRMFIEKDLSLLEVNPLVLTSDGEFVVLDAKCSADNNALFRHKDIEALRDYDEIDERELIAARLGLSYIALDGTIGCMVNGAGLAMATMDIIKSYGEMPANFLDVGGGATKEKVEEAFKIILADKAVKGILINIFGGIMRCDVIAEGVVAAEKDLSIEVPLVVRLQGTNVDIGRKILSESGLKIIPAESMDEAAQKICELVR
ncbi:MAG: ADP-forming succinate--CoA ligase subunit beta [Candidatus Dadabacteria bacterium]|nr:MAG: ADP-forming succinate--CoA ligase subunit beta [Candidatus Dadabacteria bacterium]